MKISTQICAAFDIDVSSLVVFCFSDDYKKNAELKKADKILGGIIENLYDCGEFQGGLNQAAVLHPGGRMAAERLVLAGVGRMETADNDCYRQAAGTISRLPALKKSRKIAFRLPRGADAGAVSAVIEGFMLGGLVLDDYKTTGDKDSAENESLTFLCDDKRQVARYDKEISAGNIIADGVILVRRLASDPGNYLTPSKFASRATSLAGKYGFKCDVLNEAKLKAGKMGALLAVSRGSEEPPRLVIVEHRGKKTSGRPIVLIGKGVTFDAGGISLKQPLDMDEMKGDMTGGAIVLGAVMTAARLGIKQNIIGIIPLTENLPSGKALKPGDVVISHKGLSIEILNTDAEGRLILADALSYADRFNPAAVIDIATLTGAAKYILGHAGVPILGNNTRLLEALKTASDRCAEKVWILPIWEEHRRTMKSTIADLKNSGGKPAGTIVAAAFLENFIGKWPWAHIDIAAVDLERTGRAYVPKGASGFGLRLLVDMLLNWKKVQ